MKLSSTRKIFFSAGIFLALFFAGVTATAQSIRNGVDRKTILIGEQINYSLSIGIPSPDYHVAVNIPDSIPHFDVLGKTGVITKDKNNNYAWETKMVITSFDSGTWTIPSFTYRINHLNTASQVLNTDSFSISVGYMPVDKDGKPRDIKTIFDVSYFDWFWVYVAGGILLALILAFFLYRYIKNRKKSAPPKESRTAFDEALQALGELRQANQQNSLPVKEFHTRLADVLKNYYTHRVSKNFKNKTTAEILGQLKAYELQAETESHAATALETGDAVKFAKYHPTYTENEAALNYLEAVIKETENSLSKK